MKIYLISIEGYQIDINGTGQMEVKLGISNGYHKIYQIYVKLMSASPKHQISIKNEHQIDIN